MPAVFVLLRIPGKVLRRPGKAGPPEDLPPKNIEKGGSHPYWAAAAFCLNLVELEEVLGHAIAAQADLVAHLAFQVGQAAHA